MDLPMKLYFVMVMLQSSQSRAASSFETTKEQHVRHKCTHRKFTRSGKIIQTTKKTNVDVNALYGIKRWRVREGGGIGPAASPPAGGCGYRCGSCAWNAKHVHLCGCATWDDAAASCETRRITATNFSWHAAVGPIQMLEAPSSQA